MNTPTKGSVYEQELLISTSSQKLFDNLTTALASGDSHYTYKFIEKLYLNGGRYDQ
jgi:hypothetical protein